MSGHDEFDQILINDIDAIEAFETHQAKHTFWISIADRKFNLLDEATS